MQQAGFVQAVDWRKFFENRRKGAEKQNLELGSVQVRKDMDYTIFNGIR